MYDSKTLPLEPRKIVKKSIGQTISSIFSIVVFFIIFTMSKSSLVDDGTIGAKYFDIIQTVVFSILIISLLWTWIYQYLYYKLYFYNFSDEAGEIRKGVVAQATGHVYYSRIQNLYVDQDILDRIFGLYDVHYETAGDSSSFYSHVDGLNKENADKLIKFLIEKAKNTPGRDQASNTPVPTPTTPITMSTSDVPTPPINSVPDISKANMPISPKYAPVMAITITFFIIIFLSFMSGGVGFIALIEFPTTVIPISLIGILIIYFFVNLYAKAWVKNYDFVFDNEKGTITSGVFSRKTTIIYYNRIQNINLGQGILDRILGMNNVSIETAAAGQMATAKGAQIQQAPSVFGLSSVDAQKLKEFLLEKTKVYRANI
jgi:putative membrane protein